MLSCLGLTLLKARRWDRLAGPDRARKGLSQHLQFHSDSPSGWLSPGL